MPSRRESWQMDFVALISGGKDSIFSIMEAVSHGYKLQAVIHLAPNQTGPCTEEQDSYMFQSVASEGIKLLCHALGVPLVSRKVTGNSACKEINYTVQHNDEVEDLYHALSDAVRHFPSVKYVCSGAILSDYQRIRVEHVASRLGLVSLAFLWRRSQLSLLSDMINSDLDAIVVKVAAYGLGIRQHLGRCLRDLQASLVQLSGPPYHLNACGEGGEYETFTLDCPLFKHRIELRSPPRLVVHSDDDCYPVAYLRLTNLELQSKPSNQVCRTKSDLLAMKWLAQDSREKLPHRPFIDPIQRLTDLENSVLREITEDFEQCEKHALVENYATVNSYGNVFMSPVSSGVLKSSIQRNLWVTPMCIGTCDVVDQLDEATGEATWRAITKVRSLLATMNCSIDQVVHCWAVLNQPLTPTVFGAFNKVYASDAFGLPWELNPPLAAHHPNRVFPPSRACFTVDYLVDPSEGTVHQSTNAVAVGLILVLCPMMLNAGRPALTGGPSVNGMHVRSLSHWAPANIGPYSQAISIQLNHSNENEDDDEVKEQLPTIITFYSGQVGLIPETMELICRPHQFGTDLDGQCWLTLRHCHRVLKVKSSTLWGELYVAICLGTSLDALKRARHSFHRAICSSWLRSDQIGCDGSTPSSCCACTRSVAWVHVTDLPKHASVEWQLITLSNPSASVRIQYVDELTQIDLSAALVFCDYTQVPDCPPPCGTVISCCGFLDRTESFAMLYL